MTITRLNRLAIAMGACLVWTLALSQTAGSAYDRAIAALERNDCVTALKELEEFKKNAAAELKKHPAFAKQVDDQIDKCKKAISGLDRERRRGTEIFGHKADDERRIGKVAKDPDKSIQFRLYDRGG